MDELAALDLGGRGPEGGPDADAIRRTLIDQLPALLEERKSSLPEAKYYFGLVTVAEAHFGLRDHAAAKPFLAAAAGTKVAGWRRETTGRQLAKLVRIQGRTD